MNIKHLEWDSTFFGFKVAKIESNTSSELLSVELRKLIKQDYSLVYYFTKEKISSSNSILSIFNGKLVDKKITYFKKLTGVNNIDPTEILKYSGEEEFDKLMELVIQSGEYSRFRIDERIASDKFKSLYRLWFMNSIQKNKMRAVYLYGKTRKKGFISLSKKIDRASIELLAVDNEFRGMGIGHKLILTAENWAIDQGLKYLQVVTQKDNMNACKFYENRKFLLDKMDYVYHFWLDDLK